MTTRITDPRRSAALVMICREHLSLDQVTGNLPVAVNDADRRGATTLITADGRGEGVPVPVATVTPLWRAAGLGVNLTAVPRLRAVDVEDHPAELLCRLHTVGALVLTRLREQDGALLVTTDRVAAVLTEADLDLLLQRPVERR